MKDKVEETKKIVLPQGVTPEMVATWKEQHGEDKLRILSLPKDDEHKEFYDVVSIVPGRRVMGLFEKFMDKDPDKSKDILIKNCLLSGKDVVYASDDMFATCANAIAETMPIRKAVIKNF